MRVNINTDLVAKFISTSAHAKIGNKFCYDRFNNPIMTYLNKVIYINTKGDIVDITKLDADLRNSFCNKEKIQYFTTYTEALNVNIYLDFYIEETKSLYELKNLFNQRIDETISILTNVLSKYNINMINTG